MVRNVPNGSMIIVEMVSGEDCHLCEEAKAVIERVSRSIPFELRIRTIQPGSPDERYRVHIPVVFIDGELAFQHRVKEDEFVRRLREKGRV